MTITNVTFTSSAENAVKVEPQGWNCPWPCETYHSAEIQAWIDEGNTITPYVKPVSEVAAEKAAELEANFNIEANADVLSNGQVWKGGAASAMLLDGQANKLNHRSSASGVIHSKDHVAHTLTPNQIKDVAADVADAYSAAYAKLQDKLLELDTCGGDVDCILAITW